MTDEYLPKHGNPGLRVSHYELELDYRPASNRLACRVRLTVTATEDLPRFTLDMSGALRASKVAVAGARARAFSQRERKLRVTPAQPIAAGAEFTVEVRYVGNPKPVTGPWGEVGWEELTEGVIVASQPNGAPSWFPCNDHPSDKASYAFAITADSPYRVVVNGSLTDRRVRSGQTTWYYDQPEPMATYLATVQIGRYELVQLSGDPVWQLAAVPTRLRARTEHDLARQPRMMALFERLFGRYPFANYTVVVTDDELEIPVEAQGLATFGANHMDGHRGSERLVAHELAHQWFGNSLTVTSWQHIWLNEGFACYAEWLWSQESGGPTAQGHATSTRKRLAAQPQDLVLADPGVTLMFDDRLYKRGALTLHALRCTLGDQAFFALLRDWTERNQHGLVRTEAFTALAQQHSPVPLDELFAAWLYRPELPELPPPARG